MPRVLIIERGRRPRSGKKSFKQTIEFVSARSLSRRLRRLQKSGGGAIIQRSFSRAKKKRRSSPFFNR
jgi:DNA-binding HxlR family transcriptional regulator